MKRLDLVRHLEANGCRLVRQGGRHSVHVIPAADATSAVTRHNEVYEFLAKICRDLQVPPPR